MVKTYPTRTGSRTAGLALLLCLAAAAPPTCPPSDHGDTPLLQMLGRQDANLTDLYAFVANQQLVIAVSTNPAIPPGVTSYLFPPDLTVEIHIDNDCAVSFADPTANAMFGGQIAEPNRVRSNIRFRITFDDGGEPRLHVEGLRGTQHDEVQLFTGLRDDPFIRGPRIGRNVASIVIQLPLDYVLAKQSTLVLWATSEVPSIPGPLADLAGRALRSMMPEWQVMNLMEPNRHEQMLGMIPDVMIYETAQPAAFPNGRALGDDVVDLVGDPRILGNDAPYPSTNDVPFLPDFPYLAPPQ